MTTFVCVEVTNNVCTTWAQQVTLLPPLSAAEGLQLSGYIVGSWLLAEFLGVVISRISNH